MTVLYECCTKVQPGKVSCVSGAAVFLPLLLLMFVFVAFITGKSGRKSRLTLVLVGKT